MGYDVARGTHCDVTLGHSDAMIAYCDIIVSNDIAMCIYHDVTRHNNEDGSLIYYVLLCQIRILLLSLYTL